MILPYVDTISYVLDQVSNDLVLDVVQHPDPQKNSTKKRTLKKIPWKSERETYRT